MIPDGGAQEAFTGLEDNQAKIKTQKVRAFTETLNPSIPLTSVPGRTQRRIWTVTEEDRTLNTGGLP